MATLVGHWESLEAAEELTQEVLISGIIEENVKRGGLLPNLPVAQFKGKSAKWNRESVIPTARTAAKGATLVWEESADQEQVERGLKIVYNQSTLDHFIADVYDNINDYGAIQLMQNRKSILQKLEDLIIYGDETYSVDGLEFDGLHAMAAEFGTNYDGDSLDIDQSEGALSLANLRLLIDNMKHGVDFLLFPRPIARLLDAYIQENGISTAVFGSINLTMDDLGRRVMMWDSIPILRSDYLVAEQANTGQSSSDQRDKHASGDEQYSIFAVKTGNVMMGEPGLTYAWGNSAVQGEFWKTVVFPNLENHDSAGLRLVHYGAMLDGSKMAVGRIHDIETAAIVA